MPKIVVIEGVDFSGKTTQYRRCCDKLKAMGIPFKSDSFPNYNSNSSFFVKEYLKGTFGSDPDDVPPEVASVFYAMDRYYSYKTKEWPDAENVLFARYITSNILHQATKIDNEEARELFIEWLYTFECNVMGLPKENRCIFLDVPGDVIERLAKERDKTSSGGDVDIHENSMEYLKRSRNIGLQVAKSLGWDIISCVDESKELRSIDSINEDIMSIVLEEFK